MRLTVDEGRVVRRALEALRRGDGRLFDDVLWLGLGDGCARVWGVLVQGQFVEPSPQGAHATALTDRGERLLRRLEADGL